MPFIPEFWNDWWSENVEPPATAFTPLSGRIVGTFDATRYDVSPGRRLRVFAALIHNLDLYRSAVCLRSTHTPFLIDEFPVTYAEALIRVSDDARVELGSLPLRAYILNGAGLIREIPDNPPPRDPELHTALQDLGDEINEDIREACAAFDDPDVYYPGINEGIEPVTDEHISLVIWAMQRELLRELRTPRGGYDWTQSSVLPAVPLAELPWRIQRALVERRRFRYGQYGITRQNWEDGTWSLWNVPEDPDFVPRRQLRLQAEGL